MNTFLRRLSLRPLQTTAKFVGLGFLSLCANQAAHAQVTLPATIQAESMAYSNNGVYTETTYDTGGGLNVGWIDTYDWMAYRVNVPAPGTYKLTFRLASAVGGGQVVLNQNNRDLSSTIAVPNTGGWQKWQDFTTTAKFDSAGVQDVAVYAKAGGFNINWFSLTPDSQYPAAESRRLKVWPVGDSMTAGVSNNWDAWSPTNGGYRRNLMLLLNNGYDYSFSGPTPWPNLGDLPAWNSGYGGQAKEVFYKPEFEPAVIKNENPDAVLIMLGINAIGFGQYPNANRPGSYWTPSNGTFTDFFLEYKAFIDKILNNSNATVFIAKLPKIGDTRYYLQKGYWNDATAPNPTKWATVGDGTINPKDVVAPFNNELQGLYDKFYSGNPRVVVVDMNTDWIVGASKDSDITTIGVPQNNYVNGDGLHPTQAGYRKMADRWYAAIRKAFPTSDTLLYNVDCGTKPGAPWPIASEGGLKGVFQSTVSDKKYGLDYGTGKTWGHIGDEAYAGTTPPNPALYFAWENDTSVYQSVATSTYLANNELTYRFEVPAGGTYRVFLGMHDSWGAGPSRSVDIYVDGVKYTSNYQYDAGSYGRKIYTVVNNSGSLEVKLKALSGDALLDSIAIQRIK